MQRAICEAMQEKMANGGVRVTGADSFTAAMREAASIGGSNNLRGLAIRGTGRAYTLKPGGGYATRNDSVEPTILFSRALLPGSVFERAFDAIRDWFNTLQ